MADQPNQLELRSLLTSTKVGELSLTGRLILKPSDSVSAAAREMRSQSTGSAMICDNGRLAGIMTERDMLRMIHSGSKLDVPLSTVMTTNPKTVTTEQTLFDAIQSMDKGGCRRLPVVDPSGSPVGILDVKTIVHFLVEHFPAAIYNQASHAQLMAKHREGA